MTDTKIDINIILAIFVEIAKFNSLSVRCFQLPITLTAGSPLGLLVVNILVFMIALQLS